METKYLSEKEIKYQNELEKLREEYRLAISARDRKFIRAKATMLKLCYHKFKENPIHDCHNMPPTLTSPLHDGHALTSLTSPFRSTPRLPPQP